MTRIIIEGLQNRASLMNALSVVLEVFSRDESYLQDEHTFVPDTPVTGGHTDEPVERSSPRVLPLVPCPRRGQHTVLTECWMCWCDVMRGAAIEPEVLTPHAWQRGL